MRPSVVRLCDSWTPSQQRPTRAQQNSDEKILRLVLPFYPALLRSGLNKTVTDLFDTWKPILSDYWPQLTALQVAWKCVLKPLSTLLKDVQKS